MVHGPGAQKATRLCQLCHDSDVMKEAERDPRNHGERLTLVVSMFGYYLQTVRI